MACAFPGVSAIFLKSISVSEVSVLALHLKFSVKQPIITFRLR